MDDLENLSSLYNASRLLLILNIMIYLRHLTDYTWYLPDNYHVHVTINCWKNIVIR